MIEKKLIRNILNGNYQGDIELMCYKTCFTLAKSHIHGWIRVKRTNNIHYLRYEESGDISRWKEIPEYLFRAFIKYQIHSKD